PGARCPGAAHHRRRARAVRRSSTPSATGRRRPPPRSQVLQDLPDRVGPGTTRDATARMRAGAGEIQAIEQEAVASLAEHRAPCEELIETGLGMLDVPARQRVSLFHVERGHDLAHLDELAEPRRVPLEGLDRDLAHMLALVGPVTVPEPE